MSSESPQGSAPAPPEIHLAKWTDRFFAWLIDFIIVNIVVNAVFAAVAFPSWFGRADRWWDGDLFGSPLHYLVTSAAFFAYWAFFETARGQSIGKIILKLKTVDLAGRPAGARSIAIQSFGKAFLLPIDVILGWIFTSERRQRIFNRASDTIVIKVKDGHDVPGITYRKD